MVEYAPINYTYIKIIIQEYDMLITMCFTIWFILVKSCTCCIMSSIQDNLVQPGEILSITLYATDQVNNTREAVWSLSSPGVNTVSDACKIIQL